MTLAWRRGNCHSIATFGWRPKAPHVFRLTITIPASAQEIYDAWLDSLTHAEMTGGEASMSDEAGAEVSAWDGYITGRNLELIPGERIVQSWRTSRSAIRAPTRQNGGYHAPRRSAWAISRGTISDGWISSLHSPIYENVINLAGAHCSMAARCRVQFVFGAIFGSGLF